MTKNFILWVKFLQRDHELCVINGGTTTDYFSLGRGTRQGELSLALLFFLALEILFLLTIPKPEIEGMKIFDYFPHVSIIQPFS